MMIQIEKFHAGSFRKGIQYQYFMPEKLNDIWRWNSPELNELIERAAIRLGELNSFSRFVPNTDLFIRIHVTKEAVLSSRIEGTQTSMNEALLPESEIQPEKRNDWKEVANYIKAMNHAIAEMERLPLSGRLLKQTHRILLGEARGKYKMPGEYRSSQNWIGGLSLADATFIPPHHDFVPELMGDLEQFLHNKDIHLPDIVRIAIAHYQFETIHPFLDGNGRIGRLLITLYLVSRGIIEKPLLYLSTFFEANRGLYYDNLTRVRTHNDMLQWLKYFLVGVDLTASRAVSTLQEVLSLKQEFETLVGQKFGRRTHSGLRLLHALLQNPVMRVEDAAVATGLSYKSANELVEKMIASGMLAEITGQSRNRIFVLERYLNAFTR
jgi:Fic family protein